eukprot:Hpha_TRINITY_DN17861_c0_g1::TRINITY_DN17861_c0_g1_i1::g.177480::m.177480
MAAGADGSDDAEYMESMRKWAQAEAVSVSALDDWLRDRIRAPKVRISFPSGRRGLVAAEDIPSGADMLRVPYNLFMSLDTLWQSDVGFLFERHGGVVGDSLMMAFCLMWERALGAESTFAPWIAMLPTTFTTVLSWSEEEVAGLGCPLRIQKARRHRSKHEGLYQKLKATVVDPYPEIFAGKDLGYERFVWAQGVFNSRCFSASVPSHHLLRTSCPPGCGFPDVRHRLREEEEEEEE